MPPSICFPLSPCRSRTSRRRRRGLSGQDRQLHHPVRARRRIRHLGASAGAGVQEDHRADDGDPVQARRRRRGRLVAAQRHGRRRLHRDGHEPAAHRAAAAAEGRGLPDRRHHHAVLVPLHARRAGGAGRQPLQDAEGLHRRGQEAAPGATTLVGLGHQLGQPPGAAALRQDGRHQDHLRALRRHRAVDHRAARQAGHAAAGPTPRCRSQLGEKVRMLAVAMEARHPKLPDCPTFKELGYRPGGRRLPRRGGAQEHAGRRAGEDGRRSWPGSTPTRPSSRRWKRAASRCSTSARTRWAPSWPT